MSNTKEVQVHLNTKDMKSYLTHIVHTNQELQKQGKFPITVNVEGESGIGKTSTIKQLAEELNYDFVKLNLAQLDELGDLIGIPCRKLQVAKNVGTAEAPKWSVKWADESLLNDYKEKGYKPTGEDKTAYSLPEWVPTHEKGTIVLLDDFNRAQQRFMQAVMEITDRQEYVSWKMPKNCTIVLSSNPDNGDYQVQAQDTAMKTRYCSVNLKFDKDCWAKWAEDEGIDGRCINFLLMHPELVTQEVNARSITNFFNSISTFDDFNKEENLAMIQMLGEGSVGTEFSSMFTTFINNKLDKLITPEKMLTHDSDDYIVSALKSAIGVDQNYRADIASVLCTRFTNYSLTFSKENTITDKISNRIIKLATEDVFADDLKYYAVREILNGNKTKFQKLMMNQEIVKMATR